MCEEDEIARDFYISAYTHPLTLAIIRSNDTERAKQVFRDHCSGWEHAQFAEAEVLVSGIEYTTMMTAGEPVAVTLTPESGTMRKGPTAALSSAAKLDPTLIQWNFCVMVNYFSSVFKGNGGKEIFKSLLQGYFKAGGLQHQPNVTDVEELKRAQLNPEAYKDLIVRLWGVSAHFVDLPRELQDEMIARFS